MATKLIVFVLSVFKVAYMALTSPGYPEHKCLVPLWSGRSNIYSCLLAGVGELEVSETEAQSKFWSDLISR